MSSTPPTVVNQIDVSQVKAFVDRVRTAPELADREPHVVARWEGESRAKVSYGQASIQLGGDGEINAMQALLGSLVACDIDLVAMHASLLGIEITELWAEASGLFNVARYLGLDSAPPPGYQHVDYAIHLRVRDASDGQLARLRALCEVASPVGDTLARQVPMTLNLDVRIG